MIENMLFLNLDRTIFFRCQEKKKKKKKKKNQKNKLKLSPYTDKINERSVIVGGVLRNEKNFTQPKKT